MSSEEPEFDKWVEYKKEKYKTIESYTSKGFVPQEKELPKVDIEWQEDNTTKEYELINTRVKREVVVGFETYRHINKRIKYRTSIFQSRRAWAKMATAPAGVLEQIEMYSNKVVIEEAS